MVFGSAEPAGRLIRGREAHDYEHGFSGAHFQLSRLGRRTFCRPHRARDERAGAAGLTAPPQRPAHSMVPSAPTHILQCTHGALCMKAWGLCAAYTPSKKPGWFSILRCWVGRGAQILLTALERCAAQHWPISFSLKLLPATQIIVALVLIPEFCDPIQKF